MLKIVKKLSKTHSTIECAECGNHFDTNHYDAKKSRLGHLCKQCKNPAGQPLTQSLLRKFYNYDPNTGVLTARLPQRTLDVGGIAGYNHSSGYIGISIGNKEYLLHRIIWLHQTGTLPDQVDHIDHDKTNNRWSNLRAVTNTVNAMNTSLSTNSSTKVNGVCLHKPTGKFRAYIMVNRKQKHLGLYDTIAEAEQARLQANKDYGFHPNHGR